MLQGIQEPAPVQWALQVSRAAALRGDDDDGNADLASGALQLYDDEGTLVRNEDEVLALCVPREQGTYEAGGAPEEP